MSVPASTVHGVRDTAGGRLLIVAAAFLWSLAGVFIKFLDLPPLTIVFYRSVFAALIFTPFLRRKDWRIDRPILISVISYTAAISTFVSANKLTTAANAIVLQYTAPFFVFLFSGLVLREKISRLNGFTLAASMVGVAVIFLGNAGEPDMAGVLLALLSGALFAAYMINLRRTQAVSPVYLTWINNVVCALLLLLVVKSQLGLTSTQLGILAVMGAVQLGLPYFLFSKGLQTVPLQEASLIALIEPVLNPLWVALTVGEIPSLATLAGGGLIVAALGVRYLWPLPGNAQPAA
ncbi:MAG: EamA family transporter [Deltaproteobacteria bacterium]|nr:EamA family transporter [Deltaproteobacteria bacterium]MDZ4346357.1 EamA family transporter [Candidatus Binatia bacterium]